MNYINYNILIEGEEKLKKGKYGWVLLGTPTYTGDYPLSEKEYAPKVIKRGSPAAYYFKDCNIAGLSDLVIGEDCLTIENIDNIYIKFIYDLGDTKTRIFPDSCLDEVTCVSNGFDISDGKLYLVKYKDNVTLQDLGTKVETFYKEVYKGESAYLQIKDAEANEFCDEFVDEVIFGYTISFTKDVINLYNFSGFTVGASTINIADS